MKAGMTEQHWVETCERVRDLLIARSVPPGAAGPLLLSCAISAALTFGGMSPALVREMLAFYAARIDAMEEAIK